MLGLDKVNKEFLILLYENCRESYTPVPLDIIAKLLEFGVDVSELDKIIDERRK